MESGSTDGFLGRYETSSIGDLSFSIKALGLGPSSTVPLTIGYCLKLLVLICSLSKNASHDCFFLCIEDIPNEVLELHWRQEWQAGLYLII